MNQVLNPDELFNADASLADFDTPVDRFHDLLLAVFQSNVREAYQQCLEYLYRVQTPVSFKAPQHRHRRS